jgi:hypothetical protein
MFRIGSTMRSAKIKAITPPKLMPPFHKTAAKGTLPIEHTNETTATIGPTSGPQRVESTGSSVRKNACQNEFGTHAAKAPARSRPTTISFHMEAQSMTK